MSRLGTHRASQEWIIEVIISPRRRIDGQLVKNAPPRTLSMKPLRGTFLLVSLVTFGYLPTAAASNLDQDCNPRGWTQQFSAWWDPVHFWSAQPSSIQKEVERRVKAYQIYLVQRQADVAIAETERRKALIEKTALEEALQILGTNPKVISAERSQRLDQILTKAHEHIEAIQNRLEDANRKGVLQAIAWGNKCIAISQEQLDKAGR